MYVGLVYVSAYISRKPNHNPKFNFLCMLIVTVALFYSGSVAIRYVGLLPVLWMMSFT